MPLTRKTEANPTELASVVFGHLHYEECRLSAIALVQRPDSIEASSVGFVPFSAAHASGY